jgi:Insecticide toxin TcdB middle/N-terminal region
MVGGTNIASFIGDGDGTFVQINQLIGNVGAPPSDWVVLTGDVNGDGKTDVLMVGGTNIASFVGNGSGAGDQLASITTGLGVTTSITYAPLTNSTVYAKDSTATYPQMDIQAPLYVVSQVSTSNGVGGTYSSNYSYAGAKLDLSGRGFLGFRQMTVKDPQTGITDITNYLQSFPYLGLVSSTMRTAGTQTLGQSTNTFQFSNVSGTTTIGPSSAPYQVSLSQNVSSGADLDGSALPTVTTSNQYDGLGNATQIVVSTPDGFSRTTTNTYTNDTTNWYLGRLTQSSVMGVSP